MNNHIPIVPGFHGRGETREPPDLHYIAEGDLIEFTGYQFYNLKGQLTRIYATHRSDRSELFIVSRVDSLGPEQNKHWIFMGGISPMDYDEGRYIALSAFEENFTNRGEDESKGLQYDNPS